MKKRYARYLLLAFIFVYNYALSGPPQPGSLPSAVPGGGGGDSDADQAPDVPINMFVIPLIMIAVYFIIYYTKKRPAKI